MKTTSIALALSLLASAATAQVSGSINRDAPTVMRAVKFKNGSMMKVNYTAIHFGEGAWQKVLKNADSHERFNKMAARRPIGTIETSVPISASNKNIAAGKYDMFFTVHPQAGWILNLKDKSNEKNKVMWRMAMTDTKSNNTRFSVNLNPGAKSGTCDIVIAFGSKTVTVPLKAGAKKEKKMEKAGR